MFSSVTLQNFSRIHIVYCLTLNILRKSVYYVIFLNLCVIEAVLWAQFQRLVFGLIFLDLFCPYDTAQPPGVQRVCVEEFLIAMVTDVN